VTDQAQIGGAPSSSATKIVRDVFAGEDPVGKTLLVNNMPFPRRRRPEAPHPDNSYHEQRREQTFIPRSTFEGCRPQNLDNLVLGVTDSDR